MSCFRGYCFELSVSFSSTLTKSTLVFFAFDLYDKDGSGTLESDEIAVMCRDVYGPSFLHNRLALNIVQKVRFMNSVLDHQGEIDVLRFSKFCETHPGLLFPAFSFQRKLQQTFLGETFWKGLRIRRLHLGQGRFVSVKTILKSHVDEEVFMNLLFHEHQVKLNSPTEQQRIRGNSMEVIGAKQPLLLQAVQKLRSNSAGTPLRKETSFTEIYEATGTLAKRRTMRLKASVAKIGAVKYMQDSLQQGGK